MKNFVEFLEKNAEILSYKNAATMVSESVQKVIDDFYQQEQIWARELAKKGVSSKETEAFIMEMRWQAFSFVAAKAASFLGVKQSEACYTISKMIENDLEDMSKEILSKVLSNHSSSEEELNISLINMAKKDETIN